jgi:hypothetical protein
MSSALFFSLSIPAVFLLYIEDPFSCRPSALRGQIVHSLACRVAVATGARAFPSRQVASRRRLYLYPEFVFFRP